MIEEEIFYPAFRCNIEDDVLDEAHVEHDGCKMLIAELMNSEPGAEFYDAKMTVLSEEVKHHVREEEKPSSGMFAQARDTKADMGALAEKLRTRQEEWTKELEAKGLPTPVTDRKRT